MTHQRMTMTQTSTEAVARIILGPKSHWNYGNFRSANLSDWRLYPEVARALAKAAAILALIQPGEEYLEFKEALSDLRSLRHEYECLNGGGPGWADRNKAAWARVDELFADEDEAAYDRQQEDAHG